MTKFKVGDKVRCIMNKSSLFTKGCGWELGLIYKITEITNNSDEACYFGGKNNHGVFEPHLEKVHSNLKDLIGEE